MKKVLLMCGLAILLAGCEAIEPKPFEPSAGHIQPDPAPAADEKEDIPALVGTTPVLPVPAPPVELEKYTVVVNEVPVKELLFALSRDARVNVDVDPKISGVVTINAVEQTLPQILDRITRQVPLRYELTDNHLTILPDEPFFRTYKIDYLNLSREMTSNNSVITQISTTSTGFTEGGGGSTSAGNNSSTEVNSTSNNRFWATLVTNVLVLIGQVAEGVASGDNIPVNENVIAAPETGFLTVKATESQHQLIQQHIDLVLDSANRQVMIQATIVEVSLSDQYQAGIDWSFLNSSAGISAVIDTFAGFPVGTATSAILSYVDTDIADEGDQLNIAISLLDEFGDVRVLSSPQLMVLNNHTALLKVVDNIVFFTIETDISQGGANSSTISTVESTVHTVPVGVVMSITPQINDSESVILNVRPTISRVSDFALDPAPSVANSLSPNPIPSDEVFQNQVPQIQVREMESILRMNNRQIAVLGGLMQNEERGQLNAIPGASRAPGVGEAFKDTTKEFFKNELVIFLRPIVVNRPSLEGDLEQYRQFLDRQNDFLEKQYNTGVDGE